MIVIGIDPGLTGALCFLRRGEIARIESLPTDAMGGNGTVKRRISAAQLAGLLREQVRIEPGEAFLVVIERVAAMPGQGVSSVFSLGDTAGAIRGVLQSLGFRIEYVTPPAWKREAGIGAEKDEARRRASEIWPGQAGLWSRKVDHNRAEAALIAWAGERLFS